MPARELAHEAAHPLEQLVSFRPLEGVGDRIDDDDARLLGGDDGVDVVEAERRGELVGPGVVVGQDQVVVVLVVAGAAIDGLEVLGMRVRPHPLLDRLDLAVHFGLVVLPVEDADLERLRDREAAEVGAAARCGVHDLLRRGSSCRRRAGRRSRSARRAWRTSRSPTAAR